MAKNTGKAYEKFVKTIQETILNLTNSDLCPTKQMTVELNKIINGREFDLYWEFEYGGVKYRNVIECKDYASKISVGKIDEFFGKTRDIPDLRLIYATKTGYQSGAKELAEKYNISVLIVRECNDEDFVTKNGTPTISNINMVMVEIKSPEITSFIPIIDGAWLKVQPNLNLEKIQNRLKKGDLKINTIITNTVTQEQYSFIDLENSLPNKITNIQYIKNGTYNELLENSFLEFSSDSFSFKIKGFRLTYNFQTPFIETNFNIDLENQILGIIQNSITNQKQMIFKNGNVMHLD